MAYQKFLLVSEWCWDHSHKDFQTIDLEDGDGPPLVEQLWEEKTRTFWEGQFLKMARQTEANMMGAPPSLKQLFQVTGHLMRDVGVGMQRLEMTLKLVALFDKDNHIVVESLPALEPST